jgi:hypothetical protein
MLPPIHKLMQHAVLPIFNSSSSTGQLSCKSRSGRLAYQAKTG